MNNSIRKSIFVPRKPECPYPESFGYIYLLTNKINNHKYIGKHVYRHPYKDKGYWASGGEHLKNALKNLGNDKSKFEYEILDWVEYDSKYTDEQLSAYLAHLEEFYIDLFGTFENPEDYNETPGGDSWKSGKLNPMYNNHRFAGENHPMYGIKGKNNPRYGTTHTVQSKQKMSEKAKELRDWSGKNNPMYGVHMCGNSNPFYGRKHTEETKEKIRQANTGKGYRISGKKNGMYGRTGASHPRAVSIVQLTLDFDLIRVYNSRSEAEKQNFDGSSISDCCRGKLKTYKGFKWMYKEDYEQFLKEGD